MPDIPFVHMKDPTPDAVRAAMKQMSCFFCEDENKPAPHLGVWVPIGYDQDKVAVQSLVMGLAPPTEGRGRSIWYVLCDDCRSPYANPSEEKVAELMDRIAKKFFSSILPKEEG